MGFVVRGHSDQFGHNLFAIRSSWTTGKLALISDTCLLCWEWKEALSSRLCLSYVWQKYIYGRSGNPTREVLEDIMAALENARYGVCFSSGLGCVRVITNLLKSGDHLLTIGDLYGGVYRIFQQILPESGVQTEFIDLDNVEVIHQYVRKNTRVSPKFLYMFHLSIRCEIQYNLRFSDAMDWDPDQSVNQIYRYRRS